MFYLFNCRRLRDPVYGVEGIFGNRYILLANAAGVILQLLFTYAPPFQGMFRTRNIGIEEGSLILMVMFPVFFLMETEEWVLRRLQATSKQD
jgi:magnesium-transporting ATPase (P-type)